MMRFASTPGRGRASARPLRDEAEEDGRPALFHGGRDGRADRGSCDCPDFLKNSLGVCKHILTVLEHLYARPRLLQKALKEQEAESVTPPTGLRWDPIRPLTGAGDWLARVHWLGPAGVNGRRTARGAEVARLFRRGEDGTLVLRRPSPDDPTKRLALVEALLKLLPAGDQGHRPDPALRALLIDERKRLKWIVKQAMSPAELKTAFQGLKRTLYPYQREGVERFLAAGRLLLADDMGLGKTAQAIASCDVLWRTRRIRRGLIIAPASLKPQWAREWAAFSDLPIRVVDGTPSERQAIYERDAPGSSSSTTSSSSATWRWSAAGGPTWSCSTRRSGSRTGRRRPRSRSRD